uniref:Uncharacterized protein n=1 Tax=Macaca mulatta TaxID=9544 RepID=A0A5F8AKK1_MACMU
MADFLRNLLTFKYFRSKDCCSNGAHRERVCKFWSKQEWEADKSSSNSSSLHAPQSRYQELEVALDSSSATINQLNENVESLRIGELEQAPSAVSMQQQEEDRVSPMSCPVPWQPGFPDAGVSLKVPSAGCSVLPRRQHAHFSLLLCMVVRGSLG